MVDDFASTLSAAQAGEEWAIASLWREMQPRLLRYLQGRERAAAEDVASETWLRAARDLSRFQGVEIEFRAWMFTIARHALIDWQRRATRRPSTVSLSDQELDWASKHDPADLVIEHLDTAAAMKLIARLPPDQADVILLRVLGGLDTEHVGQLVGKRAGTVRMLQHRGLKRLSELLQSDTPIRADVTP